MQFSLICFSLSSSSTSSLLQVLCLSPLYWRWYWVPIFKCIALPRLYSKGLYLKPQQSLNNVQLVTNSSSSLLQIDTLSSAWMKGNIPWTCKIPQQMQIYGSSGTPVLLLFSFSLRSLTVIVIFSSHGWRQQRENKSKSHFLVLWAGIAPAQIPNLSPT